MTKLNKKFKKTLIPLMLILATTGLSSFALSTLFTNNNTTLSTEISSNKIMRNSSKATTGAWQTNSNTASTTNNVIDQNLSSSNKYDFENLPLQNYAADFSYTGFAMFTSSTTANGNFDQITKFATQSQLKNFGSTDLITPGNVQWIVKSQDLATILSVQANQIQLKSMLYSPGGFGAHPSLFVLANCTEASKIGSYVFRIMWNAASGPIGSETTPPAPGDYKLFQKISTDNNYFNFLSLESPSTNTIQVLRAPKVTTLSSDLNIIFKTISEASSLTPDTPPAATYTYTIPTALLATNISVNSVARFFWRLNSDMFVFYQDSTATSTSATTSGTWIKLAPLFNVNTLTITQEDILPLDLSTYYTSGIFSNNTTTPLIYNLVNISSDSYRLLISQSTTASVATGASKFVSISFSLSTLLSSTNPPVPSVHDVIGTNIYFKNVEKMYGGANNANIVSYLALDSLDRVVKLDKNFSNPKIIYNFKQASLNLGNIPIIYTKVGDSSWYALMSDTKFVQFLDSNLIGRWDQIASSTSLELAVNFDILNYDKIKPIVIYQKIANDEGNGYSTEFNQYLGNSTSYNDFMNITFVDPRLGGGLPNITVTPSAFSSQSSREYNITLTFKQTLRQLNPDGSIDTTGTSSEYTLFSQAYKFINAEGNVYGATGSTGSGSNAPSTPFEAPSFLKNKFPSEITDADIRQYLIKYSNVPNFIISKNPSDLYGILDITINVPIMWKSNGVGSYFIVQNELITFGFGNQQQPFFKSNPLFGQNTSTTVIDENYINVDANLINKLTLKYSATLPSAVSFSNIVNDFIIFGTAFYNQSLINSGLIVLPTEKDVTLIPLDKEGQVLVRLTIPKIGNISNKELLFYTPKLFLKDPTANESIYFSFRNNEDVLNTNFGSTNTKLSAQNPSLIAKYLNGYNNPNVVQTILNYFAIYSSYFNDLINNAALDGGNAINIDAIADDVAGTLDVQIQLQSTLPNSNIYRFERIFYGFAKSGTVPSNAPTFSFANIPNDLLGLSPSNISISQLENANVFSMNDIAKSLQFTINLEPINTSGILGIKVVFYNWVESGNVTPIKEFSRYYSGFRISKEPVSMIAWKSFKEIDEKYRTVFPTFVVNSIKSNEPTNLGQLLQFANISESIQLYLRSNDSKLSVNYIPNDSDGTISIIATLNGYLTPTNVVVLENKISGFNYIYVNTPISFESENSLKMQSLKSKLPSDISDDEVSSLYQITYLDDSPTLEPSINIIKNNINGTLSVAIELKDPTTNAIKQTNSIVYSGFSTLQPQKSTVDYLTLALVVVIPMILLIPPIIFISYFKNKKEIKRVSELLDKRLTDTEKKDARKTSKNHDE
ncbi:MAG: lipoprotein 17-related variable surface protein [Malacoplasma sp.]